MDKDLLLGYVVARGLCRITCYNEETKKWHFDQSKATCFESVNAAENAIEKLEKYKKSACIMKMTKKENGNTSIQSMSWIEVDNLRKDK